MEDQKYALKMQKEMAEEIEKASPKYLILVSNPYSWLVHPESERYILDWVKEYCEDGFSLVGIVDMLPDHPVSVYRWDGEAMNYFPRSPYFLSVYKRKGVGD
jgi:hypothetical protein